MGLRPRGTRVRGERCSLFWVRTLVCHDVPRVYAASGAYTQIGVRLRTRRRVYAYVLVRGGGCVYAGRLRIRRQGCVYAGGCVYASGGCFCTQRVHIRTRVCIGGSVRIRERWVCIHRVCVYAPPRVYTGFCVYAPPTAYTQRNRRTVMSGDCRFFEAR